MNWESIKPKLIPPALSIFFKYIPVGYHYLQLVEWASAEGTSTFCSRISILSTSCSQWGGIGWLKA